MQTQTISFVRFDDLVPDSEENETIRNHFDSKFYYQDWTLSLVRPSNMARALRWDKEEHCVQVFLDKLGALSVDYIAL